MSRVSCPFILRGRHPAVIPPLAAYARYPASLVPPTPPGNTPSTTTTSSSSSTSIKTETIRDKATTAVVMSSTSVNNTDTDHTNTDHTNTEMETETEMETATLQPPSYPELPDLEGSSMKLIHKLLDLKRQKCLRENSDNADADWVLSAYKESK